MINKARASGPSFLDDDIPGHAKRELWSALALQRIFPDAQLRI